jgi:mRNA interferase RelE/StbE
MAYRVELTPSAVRQLRRLAPDVRQRIAPVIDHLADEPRSPVAVKLSGSENRYRLRVGNYRILDEPYDEKHVVLVVGIGHRREIYRSRR